MMMENFEAIQNSEVYKNAYKGALELKNLIFKLVLVWAIGLVIVYFNQSLIYNIYVEPLRQSNLILSFLAPTDSIIFYVKIYSVSAIVMTLPIQIYLFWNYVKDALVVYEQNLVKSYFWVGATLSVVALIYGWIFMIPSVFKFLISINPPQTQLLLSSKEYSSFIFGMLLMLVLTFQIPLIVFSLIKSGLFTKQQITDKRREIYVAILIITAIFGSPDILTWLLSTIPVIGLFELSLFFSSYKITNTKTNTNSISCP
jgi:sec-independent protein translocase protein TatC